jgi:hypothetical protein
MRVNGYYISARQRAALNPRLNAKEEKQTATCTSPSPRMMRFGDRHLAGSAAIAMRTLHN